MTQSKSIRSHAVTMLVLGLPLIGSNIAQFSLQVTDTLMMGWYDVEGLAGMVLAGSLFFVLFIVGGGFGIAVMPLVATYSADGNERQIRRVTRMGMWLSVLYGMLSLPLMLWSEPLFLLIGQDPQISALAQQYLTIAAWGLFPSLLVMVLKNYLAALEHTQIVLWSTIAAVLLNILANWVLIFGNLGFPELGIRGAAIASIVNQLLTLVILVVYARRYLPEHDLFQRIWRPDWEAFFRVFRIGTPIGLTYLAESGLFSASAVLMGWLGTIPLAAHGIALQLAALTFMVHLGLSSAATVVVGKAYGRRNLTELRRGSAVATGMSVAFSFFGVALFLTFPEFLISLFIDPTDPDKPAILAAGVALLMVAAVFQLFDGLQAMGLGFLRGVHDTKVPMIIAAISYWPIGMSASYLLGFTFGWGGPGVWAGLVFGLFTAAVLLMWRFWGPVTRRLAERM